MEGAAGAGAGVCCTARKPVRCCTARKPVRVWIVCPGEVRGEVRGSRRCRLRKWREAGLQGAGRPSLAKCFKSLCSTVAG